VAALLALTPRLAAGGETGVWVQVAAGSSGPGRLSAAAMAYHDGISQTVLFGGYNGGGPTNETWFWNGSGWTHSGYGMYYACWSAAMAYDASKNVVLLHGGCDPAFYGATSQLVAGGWDLLNGSGPPYRCNHVLAYDPGRQRVLLFAGADTMGVTNDLLEWTGSAWQDLGVVGPGARRNHAMVYDEQRGVMLLFAGEDDSNAKLGDTWTLSGSTWTQVVGPNPGARANHAMAYDDARGRVVMFGGESSTGTMLADTWEWDGAAWEQTATTGPAARFTHAMAFDRARGRTVLYGGRAGDNLPFDDTWEYYVTGGGCSGGSECPSGFCVDSVCCDVPSCPECQRCDQPGREGACAPIENGTTCNGGQCWWGICMPLTDGGFGPDAPPPPPDGAQLDGPEGEVPDGGTAADQHGLVGWSCAAAPGGVVGLTLAALLALGLVGRRKPPGRRSG